MSIHWLSAITDATRSIAKIHEDTDDAICGTGCRVRFTRVPELGELPVEVVFASSEHDTTICRLPGLVESAGVALGLRLGPADRLVLSAGSGRGDRSRSLVLGHPRGHDVRISLYDNRVIELLEGEGRLRYRSPTVSRAQ